MDSQHVNLYFCGISRLKLDHKWVKSSIENWSPYILLDNFLHRNPLTMSTKLSVLKVRPKYSKIHLFDIEL